MAEIHPCSSWLDLWENFVRDHHGHCNPYPDRKLTFKVVILLLLTTSAAADCREELSRQKGFVSKRQFSPLRLLLNQMKV